jgi:hypothetical protein
MLERYSHVRMEAKRNAMEALAASTKTAGYDTNHDTNVMPVSTRPVLRDLVDLVGIEPTTSSMPWKRAPSCATGPLWGKKTLPRWKRHLYFLPLSWLSQT